MIRLSGIFLLLAAILTLYACREGTVIQKDPMTEHRVRSLEDEVELLYRLELLPRYRENSLVEQVSSYDTTGGNNDGFSGLYSFIRKEGNDYVLADLEGPGVIERIWTPTPSEDTIAFYFDGEEQPRIERRFIDLFTGGDFPFLRPLAGNEVGGYYCYVPIPYRESCKIVYRGDQLYFHQIQYRKLEDDNPISSFSPEWSPAEQEKLEHAAAMWSQGFVNVSTYLDSIYQEKRTEERSISLKPGESADLIRLADGGRITGIRLEPASVFEGLHKDLLVEISWDEDPAPAVYCPVADFFGYAYGKPAMQSILLGTRNGVNYSFIPMPFDEKAVVRIIYRQRNDVQQEDINFNASISYSPLPRDTANEGKLYTTWRREIRPEDGKAYLFQESSGKGHHIGTILQAQGLVPGMTGFFEGDDSTRVDGVLRIHGTGSEDYFNGGWYALANRWDKAFNLPIHGCLDYSIPFARTGGYRFYLTDKIPYREHFYHTIEHGPENNAYPVDYTSIAFYYSDQGPETIMEPEVPLRVVYMPDTLVVLPNLMKVTVGINQTFDFKDWYKGIFSGSEAERPSVIHLDELPDGHYAVFLNYQAHPDGCDFTLWQRQQPVSGLISTRSGETETVTREYAGDIRIDDQYRSLSVKKRTADPSKSLVLTGITLVRK